MNQKKAIILYVAGFTIFLALFFTLKDKNQQVSDFEAPSPEQANTSVKTYVQELSYDIDTSKWRTYSDNEIGITMKYPSGWSIKKGTQYVPEAIVVYTDAKKPQERSHNEEIVIGDWAVYSTSGGVCANTNCRKMRTFKTGIFDQTAYFEVIRASWPDERSGFMHFTSFADGLDIDIYPPVYFSYYTEDKLEEIVSMLNTLQLN